MWLHHPSTYTTVGYLSALLLLLENRCVACFCQIFALPENDLTNLAENINLWPIIIVLSEFYALLLLLFSVQLSNELRRQTHVQTFYINKEWNEPLPIASRDQISEIITGHLPCRLPEASQEISDLSDFRSPLMYGHIWRCFNNPTRKCLVFLAL